MTFHAHLRLAILLAALATTGASAADGEAEAPLKVPPPPGKDAPLFVPAEYPMPGHTTGTGYQMRCWQKGQLLFTESNLSDPVIANLPGKVATFAEKSGNATYLIEVADSLCLIKRR